MAHPTNTCHGCGHAIGLGRSQPATLRRPEPSLFFPSPCDQAATLPPVSAPQQTASQRPPLPSAPCTALLPHTARLRLSLCDRPKHRAVCMQAGNQAGGAWEGTARWIEAAPKPRAEYKWHNWGTDDAPNHWLKITLVYNVNLQVCN